MRAVCGGNTKKEEKAGEKRKKNEQVKFYEKGGRCLYCTHRTITGSVSSGWQALCRNHLSFFFFLLVSFFLAYHHSSRMENSWPREIPAADRRDALRSLDLGERLLYAERTPDAPRRRRRAVLLVLASALGLTPSLALTLAAGLTSIAPRLAGFVGIWAAHPCCSIGCFKNQFPLYRIFVRLSFIAVPSGCWA
jgi:hypothetical protein